MFVASNKLNSAFLTLLLLFGCQTTQKENDLEKWKTEIISVEKAFNDMAQKDGLAKAFEYFASEEATIKRKNKVIKGKTAIRDFYIKTAKPNESLSWRPTFVDVSTSGDMAYTYGDYTFSSIDSLGARKEIKGIFHTVWKRQKDGSWRFVWD